jgi:replication factor C small subunit
VVLSELLWAEKYRPRSLNEVVNQKEIVERLKRFIAEKSIPHMLFAGPPGTGKTTIAHALAHDLYGENYRQYMLELNASDERKIEVIRTKVKEFARSRVVGEVPFKIVLLDEADNMTSDAQQALRRLMELYSANTRFILTANYPSKIIEPIQSRCAVFRFTSLKREDVVGRLMYICNQEKVVCREKALDIIYDISEGDMRRAINILQAAAALGEVTEDSVYKVVGLAHPREVREMLQLALAGNFVEARRKLRDLMINYGLSGVDIIKQIHREIFSSEVKLPDELRIIIADYAGEIQFRLVEGADDEIQLNAFLARLSLLGKKIKV